MRAIISMIAVAAIVGGLLGVASSPLFVTKAYANKMDGKPGGDRNMPRYGKPKAKNSK